MVHYAYMIRKRQIFVMITLEVFGLTMMVLIQSSPLDCLLIPLSMTSPSLESVFKRSPILRMNLRRVLTKLSLYFIKALLFLSSPLASIFNIFLEADFLPPEWSVAYIRPICKKRCSSDPSNFRPISLWRDLLSLICLLIYFRTI